jgi:rfaE bifunctional protein nucleotidyltransferase chain/domain
MPACRDREALLALVSQWRRDSKSIVFTNGCFDLLHQGHIAYLTEAAQLGDYLVVGVNSDQSVQRLKGPSRPIKDEETRLQIIAALKPIGAAVLFEEDTPLELIKVIKPDILVKGGDYKIDEIVGADFVTQYGGEVRQLSFLPGHSSSSIIDKIKSF